MKENAYAKINLYLDVTGKRTDGYHDISSYMASCSLHDEITIEQASTSKIEITSNDSNIPLDEKNLCYKAAIAYLNRSNIVNEGMHIHIEQHIPTGTGLGSASTDAAATLRCLNKMYGERLDLIDLFEISKELSADMPYCLLGGFKLANGIGDRLLDAPPIPNVNVIIAKPENESFSTRDMYATIDQITERKQHCTLNEFVDSIQRQPIQTWNGFVYNVFEECIPQNSAVWNIKKILSKGDCCILTGSGSGVIALVEDDSRAKQLYQEISSKYLSFLCKII